MTLIHPVIITSSLLPGVRIGAAEVCIEYAKRPGDGGRTRYRWTVNLPDGTQHTEDDLQSGCGGGSLREGLESLLDFLGAAAESWRYAGEGGENSDLFPRPVVEWAAQFSDEIGMARLEIEETPGCIEE